MFLKAGLPVPVVAARLGHADPDNTLRVYAPVLDDQASGAATTFENHVKDPAKRPSGNRVPDLD